MKIARFLSALVLAAWLSGGATTALAEEAESGPQSLPAYVYYADSVLLRWVAKAVHQHGLTDLPNSSLIFLCATSDDGTYREVEIRKKATGDKKLDLNAATYLFAVRIDLQTAALVTDAPQFDGKTYSGERKFRLLVPGVKRHAR